MQFCVVYARYKLNVVLSCSLMELLRTIRKLLKDTTNPEWMRSVNQGKTVFFPCRLTFDELRYNFDVIILG